MRQNALDTLCERLAKGVPLAEICRAEGMPGLTTVYTWAEADADLSARIKRAREAGEEVIAASCLTIADTPQEGLRLELGGKDAIGGRKEIREDMLGHRKLQIDTRLRLLAKWNRKKWGENSSHEVSGPNGAPIGVKTETRNELIDAVLALVVSKPDAGGAK